MKRFLTPQVRTFVYGATAALLSVATVQGWITQDVSKAIETSIPTIIGALASIVAAANVKPVQAAVAAPVVPDRVDAVAPVSVTHVVQQGAVELPL